MSKLAIALEMKNRNKRKKMAEGGLIDSVANAVKESFSEPKAPDRSSPGYNPRKLSASKTKDFQKGFGYADGGVVNDKREERPASIAAAIMARKDRQTPLNTDSNIEDTVMMAEGGMLEDGQTNLAHNSEEEPNQYYPRNREILKENYAEDMLKMEQSEDSSHHGDEKKADDNKNDMIRAIRSKMISKRIRGDK